MPDMVANTTWRCSSTVSHVLLTVEALLLAERSRKSENSGFTTSTTSTTREANTEAMHRETKAEAKQRVKLAVKLQVKSELKSEVKPGGKVTFYTDPRSLGLPEVSSTSMAS